MDTLENLVVVVETLATAVFHAAVIDAAENVKGKGNVFQRIDDTAALFVADGYPDLRTLLDAATWERLLEVWATRHVFTHNDGVVNAKFRPKYPPARRGAASDSRSTRHCAVGPSPTPIPCFTRSAR